MSIATEIKRLQNAKAAIKTAIEEKGVIVGDVSIDTYADKVREMPVDSTESYEQGYADGIEQGKQAEYDTFWDNFQRNGEPMAYTYAFANERFTDVNYNPKYDIVCRDSATSDAQQIFYRSLVTDTKVPIKIGKSRAVTQTFSNSGGLITIRKLIVDEGCSFPSTFNGCTSLKNITIEGTIGNDFDIKPSPLNKESIISIVEHLSVDTSGKTASFKKTAVDTAFETSSGANDGSTSTEWTTLIQPYSNWTISLV